MRMRRKIRWRRKRWSGGEDWCVFNGIVLISMVPFRFVADINQSGEIDVKDFEQAIEVRLRTQGQTPKRRITHTAQFSGWLPLLLLPRWTADAGLNNLFQLGLVLYSQKICKLRGWEPGSPKNKETYEIMMCIWEGIRAIADKDNDGQVSFHNNNNKTVKPPGWWWWLHALAPAFIHFLVHWRIVIQGWFAGADAVAAEVNLTGIRSLFCVQLLLHRDECFTQSKHPVDRLCFVVTEWLMRSHSRWLLLAVVLLLLLETLGICSASF